MKKFYTILFIIIVLTTNNLLPQRERQERIIDEEGILNNLSKTAFIDSTQLDSILLVTMNTYHIPGLTALITSKADGIAWKRNFGYANLDNNKTVEDTTIFLLASVSKLIVATSIMQFWEADSFDLDDNINDYLDGFQVHIPSYPNDTITFRMLMNHTSSIRDNWYWLDLLTICGDSPIPLDTFLINYFTPGGTYYNQYSNFLSSPPGTVCEYSNVAVCILAYIVERFSGMSFAQYCQEKIFDPLEMHKTSWFLNGLDTTAVATPYLWSVDRYIPYCHYGSPDYPDGQLRTTKVDLEHFMTAYMNWGVYNSVRILDSTTVDLILSDHLGYPIPGYGDIQGLVWYKSAELNNRWPWGHTGGWSGCRTAMFFQQDEDWGVICFMNSTPSYSVQLYILNLLCDYAQTIPVELTTFTAASNGKEVILNWSTATEVNNQGFEVQRSRDGSEFLTVEFIEGNGTTTEQQNYTYIDRNLENGKYYYRLKQVDFDGSYEYSSVAEVDFRAFSSFLLEQNYPNPFNPTTTISFGIQSKSNVNITILNAIGEEVALILNEAREPGFHQIEFNAANLPSGVYFYQLKATPGGGRAGNYVNTKKMILMK